MFLTQSYLQQDVSDDVRSSNITSALNEIKDQYDPARPNDYEDYLKERKKKEGRGCVAISHIGIEKMAETLDFIPTPKPGSSKKNFGEEYLKKMGWKGKGHGKRNTVSI